jgi:hypothetical protein
VERGQLYIFMNDILHFPLPLKFLQLIFMNIRVINSREIGRVYGTKQMRQETHAGI